MQAFIKKTPGVGNMVVGEVPIPAPQAGEALVRIAQSGMCGTEILVYDDVYRGRKRPVPYPLIVGHEASGEVVELGPGAGGPAPGTRVGIEAVTGCGRCFHCLRGNYNLCPDWHHIGLTKAGALAGFVAVPASTLLPLPEDVSFDSAAFLEPLATAVHTLERARPSPGQSAAIIGPGALGLLHLQVLRAAGVGPILVLGRRGDEKRLELARVLGADAAVVADRSEAGEHAARISDGAGVELVIEAAGSSEAVQTALDIVGGQGTLVTLGIVRNTEIDALNIMRKNLVWMGVVASVRRHFAEALRLIQRGKVQPERLITHRMGLKDALTGVQTLRQCEAVKIMFSPEA
jgi:2-desacetyl-2-hydroxyethyl bacteriochlorophyllide A dehydrogenase